MAECSRPIVRRKWALRSSAGFARSAANVRKSPPAMKWRPAPRNTTARNASSAAPSAVGATSASISAKSRVLSESGRLSVSVATRPSRSMSSGAFMADPAEARTSLARDRARLEARFAWLRRRIDIVREPFERARNRREMDVDNVVDLLGIAAGHRDGDRNAGVPQRVEDKRVACRESRFGQRKLAEAVAAERVGACEVDRELRARALDGARQRMGERREIGPVVSPFVEFHVEVGATLAERKVSAAVHREREHGRVAGKNGGRAVALVDVEVDDQDAFDATLRLHRARGDRGVVEDAEAFAEVAMGVVRAAGEVDAATAGECAPASREGRAGGSARTLHHA